jgi:hypothetical protein
MPLSLGGTAVSAKLKEADASVYRGAALVKGGGAPLGYILLTSKAGAALTNKAGSLKLLGKAA